MIEVQCILDILGSPQEFIIQKLKEHVQTVKEKYKVTQEEYAEPEQKDEFYSTFVELTVHFKTPQDLLDFCFESMPSSVEIINPETMELQSRDLTNLLNDFQTKLHQTDMLLKQMGAEKQLLDINAVNTIHNFIRHICKEEPKTLEEISKIVGLKEEALIKFLDGLTEKGKLKKEGNKYKA